MDAEYIEKFCANKAKEIVKILLDTYEPVDFEIDSISIQKEIYDAALSYAKIFFFEAKKFLSEASRVGVRLQVRTRFDVSDKEVKKMKDVDLLAHCIKAEVTTVLWDSYKILF